MLSLRAKYHITLFIVYPIFGFILLMLAANITSYFGILLLLWVIYIPFYLRSIGCPRCGSKKWKYGI